MSKKDLIFSLVTGFMTGTIVWRIAILLELEPKFGIPFSALIVIVPLLWVFGVGLGYFLGRWMSFFHQFGKFAAIGFTNAAVDFGVLNTLIFATGIALGASFTLFKILSFIAATVNSYIWNKYWSFNAGNSQGGSKELSKFITVAVISLLINVGAASLIANVVGPLFGLNERLWANIAAVVGSAVALIFSFVGFKLIVFKR